MAIYSGSLFIRLQDAIPTRFEILSEEWPTSAPRPRNVRYVLPDVLIGPFVTKSCSTSFRDVCDKMQSEFNHGDYDEKEISLKTKAECTSDPIYRVGNLRGRGLTIHV